MKQLTLIRHAKSSWSQVGLDDAARPLNGRGKRDARKMGKRLAAIGFMPDKIIASPAKRARTTANRLCKEIGYPKSHIELEEDIYHATLADLLQIVRELDDVLEHVALVGHNPGFSDLSGLLSQEYIGDLPTCSIVRLQLDISSWQAADSKCGSLLEFDFPKRKRDDET